LLEKALCLSANLGVTELRANLSSEDKIVQDLFLKFGFETDSKNERW
jgi:hypothetical protein